jgi:citrate lyase subunit beta/citryl-CoA lyase
MLFVPGHKLDWMLKAPRYGADALIFDLEDAVPPGAKAAAREATSSALAQLSEVDVGRFVRVNGFGAGSTLDDLGAVVGPGLDGVFLPKVRSAHDVTALDVILGELEAARGLDPARIEIVPLPETARALHQFHDVCMASGRIRRVPASSGATPGGDVHRALGTEATDEGVESLYIASKVVLDARAAGVDQILGGMTTEIADLERVRIVATRARQRGATGTMVIHPSHVLVVNEVFSPSVAQLEEAVAIVDAMARAIAAGDSATRHGGRLVDIAHARTSLALITRARQLGMDVPTHEELQLSE